MQSFLRRSASLTSPSPAASFDILRDELGESRIQFPHAMYMVAGSQADAPGNNALTVARLTQLSKMRHEDDDSEDSEDSDDEGDASRQPVLQSRSIAHHGCVVGVSHSCLPGALTRVSAGVSTAFAHSRRRRMWWRLGQRRATCRFGT